MESQKPTERANKALGPNRNAVNTGPGKKPAEAYTEFQKLAQSAIKGLEPIREAVNALEAKRDELRKTEKSLSTLQTAVEDATLALDEAEVAAAMNPTAATQKALNDARGALSDAQQELEFAKTRVRGFQRLIDEDVAALASGFHPAKIANELKQSVLEGYVSVFEVAWKEFQAVLGQGLLLASVLRIDHLSYPLRKVRICHPADGSKTLFSDHEYYLNEAIANASGADAVNAAFGPVAAEIQQLEHARWAAREQYERMKPKVTEVQRPFQTQESFAEFAQRQRDKEDAERQARQKAADVHAKRYQKARITVSPAPAYSSFVVDHGDDAA